MALKIYSEEANVIFLLSGITAFKWPKPKAIRKKIREFPKEKFERKFSYPSNECFVLNFDSTMESQDRITSHHFSSIVFAYYLPYHLCFLFSFPHSQNCKTNGRNVKQNISIELQMLQRRSSFNLNLLANKHSKYCSLFKKKKT